MDVCEPLAETSPGETEVTATPCTTTAGSPQASPHRTQPKRSTLDKVCHVSSHVILCPIIQRHLIIYAYLLTIANL